MLASAGPVAAQGRKAPLAEEQAAGPTDCDRLTQLYRAAADEGYPLAQVNLGMMYEGGQGGLAESDREAEKLCRLAADQGFPAGQANLGTCYVSGRGGLRRDDREAVRLWRLAADGGVEEARNNLRKSGRR